MRDAQGACLSLCTSSLSSRSRVGAALRMLDGQGALGHPPPPVFAVLSFAGAAAPKHARRARHFCSSLDTPSLSSHSRVGAALRMLDGQGSIGHPPPRFRCPFNRGVPRPHGCATGKALLLILGHIVLEASLMFVGVSLLLGASCGWACARARGVRNVLPKNLRARARFSSPPRDHEKGRRPFSRWVTRPCVGRPRCPAMRGRDAGRALRGNVEPHAEAQNASAIIGVHHPVFG